MTHEIPTLLSVQDLHVIFSTPLCDIHAVNGISYCVSPGEIMGIVGESGSGKSVAANAVMRLLRSPGKITKGDILFNGTQVLHLREKEMTNFRGSQIGMIFQDPMKCLDPVFTIGWQLIETVLAHEKVSRRIARLRALDVLAAVGIHDPERIMKSYQHELSGGMRQRVMIAMALILHPKLIIADEPTTALDVSIQDQIVQLLKDLCHQNGMGMVFITHNLGIVADICDRVAVMYGGRILEHGFVEEIFQSPAHPYTQNLLHAIPQLTVQSSQRLQPIKGDPIDPRCMPSGCPFHPRCHMAQDICRKIIPPEIRLSKSHCCSCWQYSSEVIDHE